MKDILLIKEKRKVECIVCGSRIDWDKAITIGYGVSKHDKMIVCSDTCCETLRLNIKEQIKNKK